MPHQCTKCGELYPDAAAELLKGCVCGSKFFYYIKQERFDELNRINNQEIQETLFELDRADKVQIEKDIREITGLDEEPDKPVILDLESVRVIKPGKFEIDIVNLFSKKRPLIYKLGEGKYIIDLSSSIKASKTEIDKKIRDPELIEKNKKDKTEDKDEIKENLGKEGSEKSEDDNKGKEDKQENKKNQA